MSGKFVTKLSALLQVCGDISCAGDGINGWAEHRGVFHLYSPDIVYEFEDQEVTVSKTGHASVTDTGGFSTPMIFKVTRPVKESDIPEDIK